MKFDNMDNIEFWKIIDLSISKSKIDNVYQDKIIIEELSNYSEEEIIEFEIIFRQLVIEADDYKVMAAQKIIEGWVSDDPYLYFRCWLIAQEEKIYTETLKNPEYLVDYVDIKTDTQFEELMYVATTAFGQKTGKVEEDETFPRDIACNMGFIYDYRAPPTKGIRWETEQLQYMYPKLWAKFW